MKASQRLLVIALIQALAAGFGTAGYLVGDRSGDRIVGMNIGYTTGLMLSTSLLYVAGGLKDD